MTAINVVLTLFVVALVIAFGFRGYRMVKLMKSNEPTPPSFVNIIVLPWAIGFIFVVGMMIWIYAREFSYR